MRDDKIQLSNIYQTIYILFGSLAAAGCAQHNERRDAFIQCSLPSAEINLFKNQVNNIIFFHFEQIRKFFLESFVFAMNINSNLVSDTIFIEPH